MTLMLYPLAFHPTAKQDAGSRKARIQYGQHILFAFWFVPAHDQRTTRPSGRLDSHLVKIKFAVRRALADISPKAVITNGQIHEMLPPAFVTPMQKPFAFP